MKEERCTLNMIGMRMSEKMDVGRLASVRVEAARLGAAVESVDSNPGKLLDCGSKSLSFLVDLLSPEALTVAMMGGHAASRRKRPADALRRERP